MSTEHNSGRADAVNLAHVADLRAVLVDARLRVEHAIAQIDAGGDFDVVLDLVAGACIRLRDARSVARFAYQLERGHVDDDRDPAR
jgi:hypothetical protein